MNTDSPPFDPAPHAGDAAAARGRTCAARKARPPRPSHHSGWLRTPGGPWRLLCRRPTWGDCWAALIPLRVPGSPALEKVVREGDRHPEHRRKPR